MCYLLLSFHYIIICFLSNKIIILILPVWRPVRMHKRSRYICFQLDDGESEGGDRQAPWAIDWAVPFKLGGGGQAELVRQVSSLVMVLAVLMFVECQDIGAVLVVVNSVLSLLAQFEQAVQIQCQLFFQDAESQRVAPLWT